VITNYTTSAKIEHAIMQAYLYKSCTRNGRHFAAVWRRRARFR
jgi:hypothetical protein